MVAVSTPSQSSYDELAALVVALQARIVELEALLRQNSSNSSLPVCHEREGGGRVWGLAAGAVLHERGR